MTTASPRRPEYDHLAALPTVSPAAANQTDLSRVLKAGPAHAAQLMGNARNFPVRRSLSA